MRLIILTLPCKGLLVSDRCHVRFATLVDKKRGVRDDIKYTRTSLKIARLGIARTHGWVELADGPDEFEPSKFDYIRVTLVQEVGRDIMVWGWIQLKMSQTLLVWSISYVLTDLAKFKGLLIKIKVIKGFPAKLKVLKDCNQIKGF